MTFYFDYFFYAHPGGKQDRDRNMIPMNDLGSGDFLILMHCLNVYAFLLIIMGFKCCVCKYNSSSSFCPFCARLLCYTGPERTEKHFG